MFNAKMCNGSHEAFDKLMLGKFCKSLVDGRPPCINGDIAIQWEWSNFDHL